MNRKEALGLMAGLPAFGWLSLQPQANPTAFLDEFIPHWEKAHEYGAEMIEAMPADKFGYKPQPEISAYGEMFVHTAASTQTLFKPFLKLAPLDKPNATNKSEVTKYFNEIGQRSTEALRNLHTQADVLQTKGQHGAKWLADHSGQDLILRAYMHLAHHRGMAAVYLRMQGITPPRFRY